MRIGPAVIVLILVLAAAPGFAQEDDLNSDRPGVGTSAITVPRGTLQLETGIDYARERRAGEPTERRTSLATLVRFGLLDGVELRLEGEPVVALRGVDDVTDVGDFVLAAKLRLLEGTEGVSRPTLAVLPAVKLPTASDRIGSERVDALLLGLASWSFGRIGADLNAGVAAIAQRAPSGYLVQGIVTGGLSADVTDKLKLLGEVFYNSPSERDGDDLVGAVAGVAYLLTRRLAIDAAVITLLAGRGPDYRLQAGLTVRFGP
jgi:hypothetical protein